jgi:catechol 2,3-dioxygenase-like lactoylglutathione lyase family enzyme
MAVTLGWPCWIGVVADDLDRQRRFYRDVLGFTEVAAGADWVHFDLGESRLLEIVRRSGQPQYDQARYQVGYAVEDIEDARAQLIALGVQPVSDLEGSSADGGRWCYFRDVEGNVFELKERRQGTA